MHELGLKLESTKGPNSVLVIDRVEKPTENWIAKVPERPQRGTKSWLVDALRS